MPCFVLSLPLRFPRFRPIPFALNFSNGSERFDGSSDRSGVNFARHSDLLSSTSFVFRILRVERFIYCPPVCTRAQLVWCEFGLATRPTGKPTYRESETRDGRETRQYTRPVLLRCGPPAFGPPVVCRSVTVTPPVFCDPSCRILPLPQPTWTATGVSRCQAAGEFICICPVSARAPLPL